jgi:uncharacterized protein
LEHLRTATRHQRSAPAPSVLRALVGLLVLLSLLAPALAQTFPPLSGRVVDAADLLSPEQEAQLTSELEALETKSTDQLVVVTVPSLEGYAIEDYGIRLARSWAIGQKDKDNGVILIVAPNDRKVRIEVGRGLEPIMTDALASVVINSTIIPRFRRGEPAEGIVAGVKDIVAVLTGDAAEVEQRARGGSAQPEPHWTDYLPLLIWIAIVIIILWNAHRQQSMAAKSGRYTRRRGSDVIILPGGWGSSGSWSGGGGSGGGGGGFGGGGGGFGGGGSSGGW